MDMAVQTLYGLRQLCDAYTNLWYIIITIILLVYNLYQSFDCNKTLVNYSNGIERKGDERREINWHMHHCRASSVVNSPRKGNNKYSLWSASIIQIVLYESISKVILLSICEWVIMDVLIIHEDLVRVWS